MDMNAFETVRHMASAYCLSRSLHVVTDLGVADKLDEAPKSVEELAAAVGADAGALGRVLRLLAAHGVFEGSGDKFRHSPASRMLRSDHPQSMRDYVRLFAMPPFWGAVGEMEHSVRTGKLAGDRVTPGGLWAYFAQHPEASAIFNSTMVAKAQVHIGGVLAAYDFSGFKTIGDIGGGRGHLLKAVLERAPQAEGVLFDLPHVVADKEGAVSPRLKRQAGDFFKDRLPACDAYLVMEVIHDWSDEHAAAILKGIRKAAPPHARLLLIEEMVSDDPGGAWVKMLDLYMLTLIGGKQRTRQEYAALFEASGFRFQREIDTGAGIAILEATCRPS
jgi:hypothetical protein